MSVRKKNNHYTSVREELTPYDIFTESKGQKKAEKLRLNAPVFKGAYDKFIQNREKNKQREKYKKAIASGDRYKKERINSELNMKNHITNNNQNVLDFGAYGKLVPSTVTEGYYNPPQQQMPYYNQNLNYNGYYGNAQSYNNEYPHYSQMQNGTPPTNSMQNPENRTSKASRILFNNGEYDPRSYKNEVGASANQKKEESNLTNEAPPEKPLTAADVKAESRLNINYFNAAASAQDLSSNSFSPYFQFSRNSKPDRDDILTYPSYRDYLYTQLYRKKLEKIISESEFETLRAQAKYERDNPYDPDVDSLASRLKGGSRGKRARHNVGKRKISSAGMFFIAIYVMIMLAVALIIIIANNKPAPSADAAQNAPTQEISSLEIDDNESSDPGNIFDRIADEITNG
ncbi:MAG: hypothetical protein LBF12_04365 [Christensenellaceae bacterium]|jgi:hypothetical protein|nr:hypothetical protein [Christensenellaceae bacterium]